MVCFACAHPARETIDGFYRNRGVTLPSGERISTAQQLEEVLKRDYPGVDNPSIFTLSHHKRDHLNGNAIAAFIYKGGALNLPSGKALKMVSPIDYLDAVITLAFHNMLDNPDRVTPAQGNDAVALKVKLQKGVLDGDEIKEAWAEILGKGEPKRSKRVKKAVEEEEEPIEGEYEALE